MKRFKVLYLINYAPNYRDKFLTELGKYVDLTVTSYKGSEINLKDPEKRIGYKYISLERKKFLGINLNIKEYTIASEDYDIIIVGYTLWNPFRMINLFRKKKRVICEGSIFGRYNNFLTKLLRQIFVNAGEGILVYSEMVKQKLKYETKKPIIVFNNTSYSNSEITPLPFNPLKEKLNIIWVGRYQERKKIMRLYDLAKKNKSVNIRLIGPGIKEAFETYDKIENLSIFESEYENELKEHFKWCHIVFNPGHAGLLIMNSARFQRSIVVDKNSHHAPEIQLALDADQDFIDFSNEKKVQKYINKIFETPNYIEEKAKKICLKMQNYTIEYMVQQYLKGIHGEWD